MRTADAILTADLHLRDTTPRCRTDDYFHAQELKLKYIETLSVQLDCPIIVAGDFLHTPRVSPFLEGWLIKNLRLSRWHTITGQHDLINHSLKQYEHSSLHVLEQAGLNVYKNEVEGNIYGGAIFCELNIIAIHTMVYLNKPIHESVGGTSASNLLYEMDADTAKLLLTGDNHQTFTYERDGRIVLNPGSMMRMTADQLHHKPCIFVWHKDERVLKQHYLPINEGCINREHFGKQEQRDHRIDAFLNRLNTNYEIGLSFEKNIEKYFSKNKTRKPVQETVWEAVRHGN